MEDPRSSEGQDAPETGWLQDGWPPCAQAQADGVPCPEIGRDCEECEKAFPDLRKRDPA